VIRRRFRRRSGRLWCRARSGSTGFPRRFRRRFREALAQSQVRFNRVPEKVPEKVWEALVQSQVRFNGICGHLIHGNPPEVFPAFGFATRFSEKTLRLLGIPPKLISVKEPFAENHIFCNQTQGLLQVLPKIRPWTF
jgi:hypothetical protein